MRYDPWPFLLKTLDIVFTCNTLDLLFYDHVEGTSLRDDSHVKPSLVQGQPSVAWAVAVEEILALAQLKVLLAPLAP